MRVTTIISAGLLALSSAVIAQVTTAAEPKLGNVQGGAQDGSNTQSNVSAGNTANNTSDPGKP